MGQYWKPINLDKREYLNPHDFGSGLKFWEWGSGSNVSFALAFLTADPSAMGDGGGDVRAEFNNCGRWYKDRVVVIGDYSKDTLILGDYPGLIAEYAQQNSGEQPRNLYDLAGALFKDISAEVIEDMAKDENVKDHFIASNILDDNGKFFSRFNEGRMIEPALSLRTRSRLLTDAINGLASAVGQVESLIKDPDVEYSAFTKNGLVSGLPMRVRRVLTDLENRKTYERD